MMFYISGNIEETNIEKTSLRYGIKGLNQLPSVNAVPVQSTVGQVLAFAVSSFSYAHVNC